MTLCEGTWFAVPLRTSGFGVGVIARVAPAGGVLLCYFFGPKSAAVPSWGDVESLTPIDAVCVVRVGDLSLLQGEWPLIGRSASWNRLRWPVPAFVRSDECSHKAWRVYYSDSDPNLVLREESVPYDTVSLDRDALLGSGAAERLLTKLLS